MALEFLNTFGKRVRILRQDRGLNQIELAQALTRAGAPVSSSYISQIETRDDRLPSADVLAAMAKVLGTTTDYLLMLSDDPSPPVSTDTQLVIDIPSREEREFIEEWIETVQDLNPDQKRAVLEAVRVLLRAPRPRIVGN